MSVDQVVGLPPKVLLGDLKSQKIMLCISQAIVERRLMPGERLPEDALSETFGVSRTVIRKVLHQLAMTRLIELHPNKGAQVATPDQQEAKDVFDARELIEVHLTPLVVKNLNDGHVKTLNNIVKKEHQSQKNGLQYEAISLSAQFHNQLALIANNGVLSDLVMQLTARSSLIIALYGNKHSVGGDCGEHCELVELLKTGETEQAQLWQAKHIQQIYASLQFTEQKRNSSDFKKVFGI